MSGDPAASEGFVLARVSVASDQDVVTLSHRTRTAGEEFGLHAREVRNLSAATYEAARLLRPYGAEAEVRLAEGPSLQVHLRVATSRPGELRREHGAAFGRLETMVHEILVREEPQALSVYLRCPFPVDAAGRTPAPSALAPAAGGKYDDLSPEALRRRCLELEASLRDLQAELQETNQGVLAMHADLEAQADELRQSEDRWRLLLDSVQDYAICMLTPQGEIASWNAGAERLFGYQADEIIGRPVSLFHPPSERDRDVPAEHLRIAARAGRLACETVRLRRGGSAFDAHVILTAVRRGREGEPRGFALVVRDITERKRLEDDLRRRAEDLAAANRAKEDFLATLSHELRTPLNAMLGWTRLLRMGKLDAAAMARALETIERNAHIQEQLIGDILDLSRIVTGKLRLELRPIALAPVVEAAIDSVRPAAGAKGLALEADLAFDGVVLGDPDRLQQVVWNLLVNAIKFTPGGGAVTVRAGRDPAGAFIAVSDTGEGIAPDLLPIIFDRFTQGDGSVTRPHGGLGLGLSIVRHIVELHGGRVQAASEGTGHGATFTVHLPLRDAAQEAVRPAVGGTTRAGE